MSRQICRFAVVGALSTVVHLGLFAALTGMTVPSQAANLLALLVATAANTAANRRWTFGVRGPGTARHQLRGYLLLAVTWLLTALGVWLVGALAPESGTGVRTAAVGVMTALAAVVRFVAMRRWMFRVAGAPPTDVGNCAPAPLGRSVPSR